MKITFKPPSDKLFITWQGGDTLPGFSLEGQFRSLFQLPLDDDDGEAGAGYDHPELLPRVFPKPSTGVVISVLGGSILIGGVEFSTFVTGLDVARLLSGVQEVNLTLEGQSLQPDTIKAGHTLDITLTYAGISHKVFKGFVTEPPSFHVPEGGVGEMTLRGGCVLALRSQADDAPRFPYCEPLPRTTSSAALAFARVRGLGGSWGGEALVEGISPDFIDGPPWEFLSGLYEVINSDVRCNLEGTPGAYSRPAWVDSLAIDLFPEQVLEHRFDSPKSKPFSVVKGYNRFDRDLGFTSKTTTTQDTQRWDPTDTRPTYQSNNSYTVTTVTTLGDTPINTRVETWGYIPLTTVVPGEQAGEQDPCAPPSSGVVNPILTRLAVISTEVTTLNIEFHASGNYLVTGKETTVEGWGTYEDGEGDTRLFFGLQAATRESYSHFVDQKEGVCPQYWSILRVGTDSSSWSRVTNAPTFEPPLQLVGQRKELWKPLLGGVTEGQVLGWTQGQTLENYDAARKQWVTGIPAENEAASPPLAQFVSSQKVPVLIETKVAIPELVELFGVRESKPVQFSTAYTSRELNTAAERFARETSGLAYSIHLVTDPRTPFPPGTLIRYHRAGSTEVHGLVWAQEINYSEGVATQSIILLRTFTEPALFAIKNNGGYVPPIGTRLEDICT